MGDVSGYDNVVVVGHPLVQHKLSHLRDVGTGAKEFRELVRELAVLLAYEATRDFSLADTVVTTPLADTKAKVLAGRKVAIFPILRAGLGMVEGVLELLPAAKVGHVGLYRDHESLEPVEYYFNTPDDLGDRDVMVVDPMLATGGSASAACEFLRARGAGPISLLVLIAAPEGIERVVNTCEDVTIYAGAVDSHLDERGYIIPGLGDAGDRLYGTS